MLGCSFGLVQIPCRAYNLGGRGRAVSTPSPTEAPVTTIRLPFRFTPDKTSSVVEVAPNEVVSKHVRHSLPPSIDMFDCPFMHRQNALSLDYPSFQTDFFLASHSINTDAAANHFGGDGASQ